MNCIRITTGITDILLTMSSGDQVLQDVLMNLWHLREELPDAGRRKEGCGGVAARIIIILYI